MTATPAFATSWNAMQQLWEGLFGLPFGVFIFVVFVVPLLLLLYAIFVGRREKK